MEAEREAERQAFASAEAVACTEGAALRAELAAALDANRADEAALQRRRSKGEQEVEVRVRMYILHPVVIIPMEVRA
jgi:hypothetical protein